MTTTPVLTVIVPCFNEAARMQTTLTTLTDWFGPGVQIVVVDDGSTDGTLQAATEFAATHAHVDVIHLEHNRGKGAAIRASTPAIRADRLILIDADLAFDRASMARAVEALAAADLVTGDRRDVVSTYIVPVHLFGFLYRRHIAGIAFNAFVRTLLPLRIRDTQCGLKAFRRDAWMRIAERLTVTGFAQDVEMLLIARALGLRHVTVPVQVTYTSAASSVRLFRSAVAMTADLFTVAWRLARGRYAASASGARDTTPPPPR